MSTAGKLWLGFGLLLLLLGGIGLFVAHRLGVIGRALTTITAVREPASAATYEMEVTLLGASTSVIDYLNTGDPARRRQATAGFASFDSLLLEFDRVARSEPSRALGRRIADAYTAYRALGDTLMTLSEEQRDRGSAFLASAAQLRTILDQQLGYGIEGHARDAEHMDREVARLSAAVAGIRSAVAPFPADAAPPAVPRLDEEEAAFRDALARYRALHLADDEANGATSLERRFAPYIEQARALVNLDDTRRGEMARFLALRGHVESLLDEGIQVLARIDLLMAQQAARGAVRTSLLAVIVLLAAGVTILTVTALPAGQGIVRTERRLREQTEELALAHRRKDEFIGILGHELRNPLAPLSNALHVVALHDAAVPAGVRDAHRIMQHQVQHIARLVDDLLDVSRINEGKIALRLEPLDLGATAARLASDLRRTYEELGLSLRVPPVDPPVWVEADPVRLDQVITNLMNNAARYTPSGGQVEVSVRRAGARAELVIRDSGIGIPASMLGQVFEPFVQVDSGNTRRHGGLGIGLTLVKRLAEMHGGSVRAESPGPGMGSTFIVALPVLADPGASAPHANAMASTRKGPSRRILVVDDSEAGASTLAELLRLWGHQVDVALDGAEALNSVARRLPELVLLDIALPGMDGYEVAGRLRAMPGGDRIRLIAVTGFGQDDDRRRALEAGFDEHMTKPVTPEALLDLLARAG